MCPWVFPLQKPLRNNGNKGEVGTAVPKNRRRGRVNGVLHRLVLAGCLESKQGNGTALTPSHHPRDDAPKAEISYFLCIN